MRVCFFGTYDRERPRNRMITSALKGAGISVDECFFDLWKNVSDKSRIGLFGLLLVALRRIYSYLFLTVKFFSLKRPDAIIVGYLGHLDVWLASLLRSFYRVPLAYLPHISLYETTALDRKMIAKDSFLAKILFFTDRWPMRLSDLIIADTDQDKDFFSNLFDVNIEKFRTVYIGADEKLFHPASSQETKTGTKVLFYGQFIPLQGIEYIVEAASLLKGKEDLKFIIVGKGQEKDRVKKLAETKNMANIAWIDWVAYEELPALINSSDIVLGIFGVSEKAARVIPNKIYQALACAKPVITADTPAIRELLKHGQSAYLCKAGDPRSLSDAIAYLLENRNNMDGIAKGGYESFQRVCSRRRIEERLEGVLKELVR